MQYDRQNVLSMEKRMEGAFMREIDQMEQRLHEVARQGRKEQTGQVVSALNSSISRRREVPAITKWSWNTSGWW